MPRLAHPQSNNGARLGTFLGVFLPCLLTILGVILFVRLGWVAGNLGLAQTWLLVTLATSITLVTGLSVAAIATNMTVGGGGSYFMISRSLGLEAGAAIGLPLFIGKALGVAFYLVGFAESLRIYLPQASVPAIATASLLVITALALISAKIAARSQMLVFAMIAVSLAGLALGGPPEGGLAAPAEAPVPVGFWVAFAVFFPAVTGIEAGVGLSGDLKNPGRSLPLGTIGAILTSYLIYMVVPLLLLTWVPAPLLRADPLVMREVMPHGALFDIGIWGAALSSALISLLAAPRTLQKLARDGIVPQLFGRGSAGDDSPRLATFLTFVIALAAIWLGGLNALAKALSMFFLTTYGLLNLAAGLEAFINNPSWRPQFRVKWWLSMLGAVASFAVMFVLNAGAAAVACGVILALYVWVHKRHLNRRWQDIRTSLWQFLYRVLVYRLRNYEQDVRNWRPNLLVFAGVPTRRWHLIRLADALSQNRGIMTIGLVVAEKEPKEHLELLENRLAQMFDEENIMALTRVYRSDNVMHGIRDMIRHYGLGPVRPNTVLLGHNFDQHDPRDFSDLIRHAITERQNLILARELHDVESHSHRIDIWWDGNKDHLGFMLAIAYLMQHSRDWSGIAIRVNCVADREHDPAQIADNLKALLANDRIDASVMVQPPNENTDLYSDIRRVSADAEVLMTGLRSPLDDGDAQDYERYCRQLFDSLPRVPLAIQVLPAEDLPFFDMFR